MSAGIRTAILLVLLAPAGCTRQSAVPVEMAAARAGEGPDQESWDFDMLLSENGMPRLRLLSPYMAYYQKADSTYMLLVSAGDSTGSRVRGTVYDADGDSTATFVADRMTWYEEMRLMEARGAVVVRARNGRVLRSEFLRWIEADRTVTAPGFSRIELEDGRLEGYGLVAREDLEDVRMGGGTGTLELDDE